MTKEKRIASMETAAWASQTRPYTSFPEMAPERLMFLIEMAFVWTSTSAQPFKEVAWKANEEFSMQQVASWWARPKKVLVWAPVTSNLVWFRTSLVFILKVSPQNAESASYQILTETAKSSRSKSVLQLRMPLASLCWPFLSISSTRESRITRSVIVMKKSEKLELARSTSASIRNQTTGVWVVRKMEFVVLLHKDLGSGSSKVTDPEIICPAPMGSSQMKLQQQLNSAIEVTCCYTLNKQLSIQKKEKVIYYLISYKRQLILILYLYFSIDQQYINIIFCIFSYYDVSKYQYFVVYEIQMYARKDTYKFLQIIRLFGLKYNFKYYLYSNRVKNLKQIQYIHCIFNILKTGKKIANFDVCFPSKVFRISSQQNDHRSTIKPRKRESQNYSRSRLMFKLRETFQRIAFQYPVYWWAMPAVGKSYLETVTIQKLLQTQKQMFWRIKRLKQFKHQVVEREVMVHAICKMVQIVAGGKGINGTRDMQVMKTIWEVITDFCRTKLEEQVIFSQTIQLKLPKYCYGTRQVTQLKQYYLEYNW
ncbi:Flavodoxin-like_fold [Hexamita inflata]|uniref:Flavodoxin-like fold n=1 Tax=Hexamita inflata TaxID=28002 RepID=A0AA86RJD9_9EUKA|nr:Flavodoxin-like fold [Hexamita inflata]